MTIILNISTLFGSLIRVIPLYCQLSNHNDICKENGNYSYLTLWVCRINTTHLNNETKVVKIRTTNEK